MAAAHVAQPGVSSGLSRLLFSCSHPSNSSSVPSPSHPSFPGNRISAPRGLKSGCVSPEKFKNTIVKFQSPHHVSPYPVLHLHTCPRGHFTFFFYWLPTNCSLPLCRVVSCPSIPSFLLCLTSRRLSQHFYGSLPLVPSTIITNLPSASSLHRIFPS